MNPPEMPAPRVRTVPIPGVRTVFTYVILGITTLIGVGQLALGDPFTYYGLKLNPNILAGEYWRLFTPIFFHANILHFLFNMYALYVIGRLVERPLGYARFLMIYFFSGIAGGMLSFLLNPLPSLGASGAIFGLIGALTVFLFRHRRILGPAGRSMLSNMIFIIVLNLAISLTPDIDIWDHIGGLTAGLVLGWLLGPEWKLESDPYTGNPYPVDRNYLSHRLPLAFILILAFFLAALWLLVR
jgi:rhomboid protease GluP